MKHEAVATAVVTTLEVAKVELVQLFPQSLIHLIQAMEDPVAQGSVDPVINSIHMAFSRSFIPWFPHPGCHHCSPIMQRPLLGKVFERRLIPVALFNDLFHVVGLG